MPRAGRRRAGGIPLRREGGLRREEVRCIRGVWVLFIFLERSPATSCQGASRRDRLPDVENYLGRLEECNQSISRSKLSRTKKEEYVPAPSTPTPNYLPPYNHHHLPPQRPVYRPQLTPFPPPPHPHSHNHPPSPSSLIPQHICTSIHLPLPHILPAHLLQRRALRQLPLLGQPLGQVPAASRFRARLLCAGLVSYQSTAQIRWGGGCKGCLTSAAAAAFSLASSASADGVFVEVVVPPSIRGGPPTRGGGGRGAVAEGGTPTEEGPVGVVPRGRPGEVKEEGEGLVQQDPIFVMWFVFQGRDAGVF